MSERFEPPHVAQRSRRDKLRVQQHQLGSDHYQNPSDRSGGGQDQLMMFNSPNSSGFLDFGHDSPPCDWIVNPNSTTSPLLPSHLYNIPAEQETGQYQNTLQEIVTSSRGLVGHGQQLNAVASETQGLSLSLSSKPLVEDPRCAGGPLGPFTGYAMILKSSKFLKPAQELMDELCGNGAKQFCECGDYAVEKRNSVSNCGGDDGSNSVRGSGNSGAATSSSFYCSTEGGNSNEGQAGSCPVVVQRPEVQQKKVRLLYMQEEVCRRYKQYHQQMQMVVSSFESVAGLSSATPYTSMALNYISKQFRSLKLAISKQLRHVSRILGEDFMSSPSSSSKGEKVTTSGLKYIDQSLRKQKDTENSSLCFLDNNQLVWRPQRGLPERAVSVLRAWLFEHFLHPYPTDTDKHMLATQTGLSRNQVSNWFINARVRLWKPMVEEIHMLESKEMMEMDLNSSNKNEGKSIVMDNNERQPCSDQVSGAHSMDPMVANESSVMSIEQWHREKRSRMGECTGAGSMDTGMMSFGYQGSMDIGGLGAVSLTLGLRHNEDSQQQQQNQLRHLGVQMLHDFVG